MLVIAMQQLADEGTGQPVFVLVDGPAPFGGEGAVDLGQHERDVYVEGVADADTGRQVSGDGLDVTAEASSPGWMLLADGINELAPVGAGDDPAEREVGVPGVAGSGSVSLPVDGVVVPGPRDDRLLLIPGEQVAPALPVAVPQLSAASCAADCPPDDPAHYCAPRRVQPYHRVCAFPDQRPDGTVVAIYHPPRSGDDGSCHPAAELLLRQGCPSRLMENRVQFHVRHRKTRGEFPAKRRFARSGVTDYRHAPHERRPYQRPHTPRTALRVHAATGAKPLGALALNFLPGKTGQAPSPVVRSWSNLLSMRFR